MRQPQPAYTVAREVPDWLQRSRRTQFHNQHAGPAKVAKAVFTFFSLDGHTYEEMLANDHDLAGGLTPDTVWEWTTKYSDETLEWLADVGKDCVMVTWSCGFADVSEVLQRRIVHEFTQKAHRRGIRVCAYLSLTNMFWKDVLRHEPGLLDGVARCSNGEPQRYGYCQGRYLACVNQPVWLEYLKRKVRLAIEEGNVDAVYFDNLSADCACDTCRDLFAAFTEERVGTRYDVPPIQRARPGGKPRDREMETNLAHSVDPESSDGVDARCCNYLHQRFTAWRITDALRELRDHAFALRSPFVFSANNHMRPFINDVCNLIYSQDAEPPGPTTNTIAALRYLDADTDGWKAVTTNGWKGVPANDGNRQERLSIAEGMAFQNFPYGLAHKPYNHFYRDHPELFADVTFTANIAVIMEVPGLLRTYLRPLGFANILYDAIVYDKWSPETLQRYPVLLLPNLEMASDALLHALDAFEEQGGTLISAGRSLSRDEYGRPRPKPRPVTWAEFDHEQPMPEELVARIRQAAPPQPVRVNAPQGVVASLCRRAGGAAVLHLLNYRDAPVRNVVVHVQGPDLIPARARLFEPDTSDTTGRAVPLDASGGLTIETLDVYTVVALSA